jgi:hypothetical protein
LALSQENAEMIKALRQEAEELQRYKTQQLQLQQLHDEINLRQELSRRNIEKQQNDIHHRMMELEKQEHLQKHRARNINTQQETSQDVSEKQKLENRKLQLEKKNTEKEKQKIQPVRKPGKVIVYI